MKKFIIIPALLIAVGFAFSRDMLETEGFAFWMKREASMPDFRLEDTNGKIHTPKTARGKYLIVNFWATWCPPCLREIPAFVEFYDYHSQTVEILGLNYETADADKIEAFSEMLFVNYPVILSTEKNRAGFAAFGEIIGMPTTFIYDPEGALIQKITGEVELETLKKIIPAEG